VNRRNSATGTKEDKCATDCYVLYAFNHGVNTCNRDITEVFTSPNTSDFETPYWCSELKHAHARARDFRSVLLRSGRPRGGQHQSYTDYKLVSKSFRRLQRQRIAKYENTIFDQLNKAADTDFKLFWKLLRRQGGSRSEMCNCLVVNGHSHSDSNVVKGFFHHFSSVFGSKLPEDKLSPDLERELSLYERLPSTVLNQFLLNPLEVTELEGAI